MWIPGLSRRWLIAGVVSLGVVLIATIGLAVVYPRVGAWVIRSKVGGKLSARIGRDVRFGAIDVAIGHAVMRNVEIRRWFTSIRSMSNSMAGSRCLAPSSSALPGSMVCW
jgi:hypothetical protein